MIIHISNDNKFIFNFFSFIKQIKLKKKQEFYIFKKRNAVEEITKYINNPDSNPNKLSLLLLLIRMIFAEKIIIHGLFNSKLIQILDRFDFLLGKCYWFIWGADLYGIEEKQLKNEAKSRIIEKIGHLVTYIQGDYDFAKTKYHATGQFHECLLYPSNIVNIETSGNLGISPKSELTILLGNSASSTNNHNFIIEKLSKFKNESMHIYCPLSYGDVHYGDQIEALGKETFGSKFIAMRKMLSLEEYLNLLDTVDIGIFAHDRQQGMGNMIQLLGRGKKVYLSPKVTQWDLFARIGLKVFDVSEINLERLNEEDASINCEVVKNFFSPMRLELQLRELLS